MGISVDRIQGLSGGLAIKAPCRTATTENITPLNGLSTVGGVALAAGDRVLVKDQTDPKENGIYTADTGDWKRALDFNGPNDVVNGTWVTSGTSEGYVFKVQATDSTVIPGISEITFIAVVDREYVGLGNVSNDAQLKIASNLSDLNNAATARGNLGLGTAATANVTTSRTDTTAGRMLKVGDFGLGHAGTSPLPNDSAVDGSPAGIYNTDDSTTGLGNETAAKGSLIVVARGGGAGNPGGFQIWRRGTTERYLVRGFTAGVPRDWSELYHTSNILGTVSQSSGVPTGAIIERGSNANGEYVRYADGTQICTNGNAAITTNPAAFSGTVTDIDGSKLRIGRWF